MSTNGRANLHPPPTVPPNRVGRWAVLFVLLAGAFFALAYYLNSDMTARHRPAKQAEVRE